MFFLVHLELQIEKRSPIYQAESRIRETLFLMLFIGPESVIEHVMLCTHVLLSLDLFISFCFI